MQVMTFVDELKQTLDVFVFSNLLLHLPNLFAYINKYKTYNTL